MSDASPKSIINQTTVIDLLVKHPQLEYYEFPLYKCRDCVDGQDAVKSSTYLESYLPPLPGYLKDPADGKAMYARFVTYAYYFPGPGRSMEAYIGTAYMKPPIKTDLSTEQSKMYDEFGYNGKDIDSFAKEFLEEVIKGSRPGILVSVPQTKEEQEDALEASGLVRAQPDTEVDDRPFATYYSAQNILDWREERINGKLQTTYVKLAETDVRTDPENEFGFIKIRRIIVLDLDEEGYYRVRLYESEEETSSGAANISIKTRVPGETLSGNIYGDNFEKIGDDIYPEMKNKRMTFIPFVPCNKNGISWDIGYPVINDLCDISLAYLRTSASYKNGEVFVGNPTPCFTNLSAESVADDGTIALGSSRSLQFDEGGSASFLEIGGTGLSELRTDMESMKKDMATVGARLLAADPSGVEAAETAQIHRAGEQSVLMDIAGSVSKAISRALQIMVQWDSGSPIRDEEISYKINIDPTPGVDTATLQALYAQYIAGDFPLSQYFHALKKAELVQDEMKLEDFIKEAAEDAETRAKRTTDRIEEDEAEAFEE